MMDAIYCTSILLMSKKNLVQVYNRESNYFLAMQFWLPSAEKFLIVKDNGHSMY